MIQFGMSTQFNCQKHFYFKLFSLVKVLIQFSISIVFVCSRKNVKTILFQTIQFRISTQSSSILPIDRTLSGAIITGHSGSGSNGNEGVLRICQSSSITGTSPSEWLVLYPGHLLGGGVLPFCREAVGVFYSPRWLGN